MSWTPRIHNCTRAAGHEGPCNGYPRLDAGIHCYTMRPEHPAYKVHVPYSGPIAQLEHAVDCFIKAGNMDRETYKMMHQRITDLEAENARLATRVNELIAMTATNH